MAIDQTASNAAAAMPQSRRIALIDAGRGVALLAMTVFHFCWDLAMFRLIDPGIMASSGMIWFARSIAGSFLFLVGFSLYLAHHDGMRWNAFGWRMAKIVAAAGLITGATWFATPNAFIFFGILHHIALASVLALAFLRLPWWLTAGIAAFFLLTREALRTPALDAPFWWWSGLSQLTPISNDYVPVFPFFGMVLLGVAAAGLCQRAGIWPLLGRPGFDGRGGGLLTFIGRHSLAYYLLHQPVMIALLYGFVSLTGRI